MHEFLLRLPLLMALLAGVCTGADAGALALPEPSIQINKADGALVLDISYRVPVPPRLAWAVLTDFENMPGFVPNLESSRILQRSGNILQVEQKGSFHFGMLPIHYESVRQVEFTPYQSIRSRTLSGDTRLESVMLLTSAGNDTLLSYHATAVSGLPIPDSLVASTVGEMLEAQFKAMGREMVRRAQLDGKGGALLLQAIQKSVQPIAKPAAKSAANPTAKSAANPTIGQARSAPTKARLQTKKRPG